MSNETEDLEAKFREIAAKMQPKVLEAKEKLREAAKLYQEALTTAEDVSDILYRDTSKIENLAGKADLQDRLYEEWYKVRKEMEDIAEDVGWSSSSLFC